MKPSSQDSTPPPSESGAAEARLDELLRAPVPAEHIPGEADVAQLVQVLGQLDQAAVEAELEAWLQDWPVAPPAPFAEETLDKVLEQGRGPKVVPFMRWVSAASAVAAVLVLGTFLGVFSQNQGTVNSQEITAQVVPLGPEERDTPENQAAEELTEAADAYAAFEDILLMNDELTELAMLVDEDTLQVLDAVLN